MGTKSSKQNIVHPGNSAFVSGIKSLIPSSLLKDVAEDNLKAIELSNGDIVTLKNACALYEELYNMEQGTAHPFLVLSLNY